MANWTASKKSHVLIGFDWRITKLRSESGRFYSEIETTTNYEGYSTIYSLRLRDSRDSRDSQDSETPETPRLPRLLSYYFSIFLYFRFTTKLRDSQNSIRSSSVDHGLLHTQQQQPLFQIFQILQILQCLKSLVFCQPSHVFFFRSLFHHQGIIGWGGECVICSKIYIWRIKNKTDVAAAVRPFGSIQDFWDWLEIFWRQLLMKSEC